MEAHGSFPVARDWTHRKIPRQLSPLLRLSEILDQHVTHSIKIDMN